MVGHVVQPSSPDRKAQKMNRKSIWKSLKLILQKGEHETLLHEVKQINDDLHTLTMQRIPTIIIQKQTIDFAKHYNRIRSHADSLYDVFRERFLQCHDTHIASLRLRAMSAVDPAGMAEQRMSVYFGPGGRSGYWRALDFEPVQRDTGTHMDTGASTGSVHRSTD